MNDQEFFTKTVTHLRAQGERAVKLDEDDIPECQYRVQKEGRTLSCAVGCHISAGRYEPSMEGTSVRSLMKLHTYIGQLFAGVTPLLLQRMQTLHDNSAVSNWESAFADVARDYKLTVPFSAPRNLGAGK